MVRERTEQALSQLLIQYYYIILISIIIFLSYILQFFFIVNVSCDTFIIMIIVDLNGFIKNYNLISIKHYERIN